MKLTIFTTWTNPAERGDNFIDAIKCYEEFADEIIIINGGRFEHNMPSRAKLEIFNEEWPQEFDWPLIGEQFQKGYEAATGDWVIRMDLDYIFHEKDLEQIRNAMAEYSGFPALSFWKKQFILPDRFNLKSRIVLAINKSLCGNRVRFNSGGDLCQPSLDGKQILQEDVPEARVAIYNYEQLIKTKEQIMADAGRMDRAYNRHYGQWLYSKDGTDESAYKGWHEMQIGRYKKFQEYIPLSAHPKYIQQTIKDLTPNQWGYNGFGLKTRKVYA